MKNKKGFTLIELLAVIVILAIIALIAVPIILNMINSARKSAARSAALGYIDAIEYNNGFASLGTDAEISGYTAVTSGDVSTITTTLGSHLKGKAPTSGSVVIDSNGKVESATDLCFNGYKVNYENGDVTVGGKCSSSSSDENISDPVSFENDSWSVINNAVVNNNTSAYNVGDRKAIVMDVNDDGTDETYYVRISNKSVCDNTIESETACGLVLEFEGSLNVTDNTKSKMNSTSTSAGGWRDSEMRTYVNNTIYNKLPSDLKNIIKTTKVISSSEAANIELYETNDKLYLLSPKEIGKEESYDNGKDATRTLDYYVGKVDSYRNKNKYGTTSSYSWWLRSAYLGGSYFWYVYGGGGVSNSMPTASYGVSPAFRIGN